MKKIIVPIFWIALGFILVESSRFILKSADNDDPVINFVLFYGCLLYGVFQFFKLRRIERISFLISTNTYEASVIEVMKTSELNLRFKFQKKFPNENFSDLSLAELRAKNFELLKDSALKGIEATGRGVRGSIEGIKSGVEVAKDLKNQFSDGYKSGKEIVGGPEVANPATSFSNGFKKGSFDSSSRSKKSESAQTSSALLESSGYYKQTIFSIRQCEDKIEELKIKIDDAKRAYDKYAAVGDDYNMRIANSWAEDKVKLEINVREIEKEMHELVLRKRQEEDRAKREANR